LENSTAKGSDLLVLIILADFADERGKAWPSNATLARKARIDERQVRRSIITLHDELKEIDVSYNTGPHGVNEYHVLCFGDPDKLSPRTLSPGDTMPSPLGIPIKEGGDNIPPGQIAAQMSPNPPGPVRGLEPPLVAVASSAAAEFPEIPSVEDVLAEADKYPGNLAIGCEKPGMPEKWCRYWYKSKVAYRQFAWERWKLALKLDFENDFRDRRPQALGELQKSATGGSSGRRQDWQLTQDLAVLDLQIEQHPRTNWPGNVPLPDDVKKSYEALLRKRAELKNEAAGNGRVDRGELREMLRVARHLKDEPEIARLTRLLEGME
jgi:hypothetical protein